MVRNGLLILILAALFTGCATTPRSPAASAPFRDTLIVPKKRIGPAVLGMTAEQMVEWLGRPDETVGSGDAAYRYGREGLQVAFDGGQAYVIAVNKPAYATADQITVGIDAKQLARWGAPTRSGETTRCTDRQCESSLPVTYHYCFANGMQADVDARSHLITQLQVRAGGCRLP